MEKEWTKEPAGRRIFGNFIESGFGRQVNGMWSEMLYNRAFRDVPAIKIAISLFLPILATFQAAALFILPQVHANGNQPFTDPTITPFSKNFCANGYIMISGSAESTMQASSMVL